ncbi:MAG TPA: universal stress protein [Bacteroidales bacterium]|nr:universal stress protein [Bacteroidales bacterium]
MNDNLKNLGSISFNKAQIISTRFETVGIELFFKDINVLAAAPGTEIKLFVKEKDAAKATALLKELSVEMPETIGQEGTAFSDEILVPVDFSQASMNASFFALELAAKSKNRIKFIHAYGYPEMRPVSFDDTDFLSGTLTAYIAEMRQEAENKLAELLKLVQDYISRNNLGPIPVSSAIINGLPDEITLYTAESENAGLILMGISRKDVRIFEPIGKMASRIVEKAKCPVLIIPEDYMFKGIDQLKNVLYTTAFDETDFVAVKRLFKIVQQLNSNIHVLHISNTDGNPWDNIKMEGLRDYFSKVYNSSNVYCEVIISKDILQALDDYIALKGINLITMVTHKRNLIGKLMNPNITLKILYHTQIPLMVFH